MSQQKNERLALACADIDAFAKKHALEPRDVLQLIGGVTGHLVGGTAKQIDADRTTEGVRLANEGTDERQIFRYHASMLVLRDVALDAESLPDLYGVAYPSQPVENPAEKLADVIQLRQEATASQQPDTSEILETLTVTEQIGSQTQAL